MARKHPASRPTNIGLPIKRIPIKVVESPDGAPTAVTLDGLASPVAWVEIRWDVTEVLAGQERPIKAYFQIVIPGGESLTVFHNLVTGSWYREYPKEADG